MVRSYYDGYTGSPRDYDCQHVILVGVASTDDIWKEFESGWDDILHTNEPRADYMHVTDAIALQEHFSKKRGWTDRKVEILINKLARFMSEQDKKRFRAFFSSVDAIARKKLIAQGIPIEPAERICCELCVGGVMSWAVTCPTRTRTEVHSVDFFFDRGEKFKRYFDKLCAENKKKKDIAWQLVNTVGEAEMSKTPGIQAADMLVWGERMEFGKRFPTAHEIFKSVIPSTRFEVTEKKMREENSRIIAP